MRRLVLNSFCVMAVFSCSLIASTAAIAAANNKGEWTQHGNDSDEQRYSKLKQITVKNVKDLGLAWTADMTETGSWQGTPIVVDGVMYATTPWSYLYAFDARTGKQLWKYSPRVAREIQTTQLCCGNQNRGATYWNGKIIWASLDGRLLAVDAKTGKLAWETSTFDPMKDAMSITGAPRVGNGVVFIGQGGGEYHQRGFMSAYDAETGRRLWKFYLVPGNPALGQDGEVSDPMMAIAAKTWKGEWWKTGGGGTVWDGIVYDSVNDLVIFGTGNGAPWPAEVRSPGGGDNLFTASIVALHARTGEYAWHYQTVPMESFDLDNTSPLTIADIKVEGKNKRVVMQIPKNGIFYVIEAKTGKVVSAQPIVPFANWLTGFDKANNWRPILNPEANYGATGKGFYVLPFQAHVWTPQSFNPETGLFYVTVRNAAYGMVAKKGATMGNQLLSIIVGGPDANPQGPRPQITGDTTWLSAWNPATQKEAWRVVGGGSGTMTTAGNLVFQSEAVQGQGALVAYSADKGEKLWTGSMGARAGSGPISYELDGEQYIAAIANARVAVFKLGGKAALPAATAAAARVLNPPANFGTEAQLAAGKGFFTQSCTICHEGQAAIGAPDLRYSPMLASAAAFKAVVIDGAKADGGMKAFGGAFTPENVEAIRAHLVSLANTLKDNPAPARGAGPGGPGGAGPRAGGPPGGAPRAGGPGGGAPRAGGPGGAPAAPAAPAEPQVGLHQ